MGHHSVKLCTNISDMTRNHHAADLVGGLASIVNAHDTQWLTQPHGGLGQRHARRSERGGRGVARADGGQGGRVRQQAFWQRLFDRIAALGGNKVG